MKDKFNLKLFLDGMRQLRTIGIMCLVIFCIEAAASVIGTNINIAEDINMYRESYAYRTSSMAINSSGRVYNLLQLHPILVAAFYIVVPIMLLYLFGFLNKRNACDFYHSVPVKRECLALSYLASIMAWVSVIILASTAVTCICAAAAPYVSLNMISVGVGILTTLAGCLCMLCGGFAAMSITGTYFSNFSVSVMLIVFPRLIIMVYFLIMSSLLPILTFAPVNSLLDYRFNIITGLPLSILDGNGIYPLEHLLPALYTIVLAMLYLALGMWLFINRKSEIATEPASNPKLQLLFRIIPAFSISLIPMALILSIALGDTNLNSSAVFYIVILYIIAIIAYFLYELMTTHKLSKLVHSARQLWILAAANVVFLVTAFIGYNISIGDIPDASEVKYVQLSTDSISSSDYFKNRTNSARITDSSVISILTDALMESAQQCAIDGYMSGYERLTVEYKVGMRTIRRNVTIKTSDDYVKLLNALSASESYASIYKNLPEYDELTHRSFYSAGAVISLDDDVSRTVYEMMCEERKNANLKDLINNNSQFASFSGIYSTMADNYALNAGINSSTPKTALLFMNSCNKEFPDNMLSEFIYSDASSYQRLRFSLIAGDQTYHGSAYKTAHTANTQSGVEYATEKDYSVRGEEVLKSMSAILDTVSDKQIDSLYTPVLCISYTTNDSTRCHYYPANEELIKLFCTYTNIDYPLP